MPIIQRPWGTCQRRKGTSGNFARRTRRLSRDLGGDAVARGERRAGYDAHRIFGDGGPPAPGAGRALSPPPHAENRLEGENARDAPVAAPDAGAPRQER